MKKLFLCLILVVSFLVSFGQSKETGRYIQDLAKRKFKWMIARQTDSLAAVLDDRLEYVHSSGLIQTKNDVIEDLKSGKLTYQDIVVGGLAVRVYDATAIVTGNAKFSGVNNGTPFAVDLLFTEVFVLKDKVWRLASRHASKLP